MTHIWSRPVQEADPDCLDYWDYFGLRLVEHACVQPGDWVLDVGCGTGSSLFPAVDKVGKRGCVLGIDICPG